MFCGGGCWGDLKKDFINCGKDLVARILFLFILLITLARDRDTLVSFKQKNDNIFAFKKELWAAITMISRGPRQVWQEELKGWCFLQRSRFL